MIVFAHILRTIVTNRSGVIPYIYEGGKLYFLLGVDRKTNELTDLGGGVKKGENSLSAAIREFKEESRSSFNKKYYRANTYALAPAVHDKDHKMSVIFLPVHTRWFLMAPVIFKEIQTKKKTDELVDIRWYQLEEFMSILFDPRNKLMWKMVQKFFITNIPEYERETFINILKECYDVK